MQIIHDHRRDQSEGKTTAKVFSHSSLYNLCAKFDFIFNSNYFKEDKFDKYWILEEKKWFERNKLLNQVPKSNNHQMKWIIRVK